MLPADQRLGADDRAGVQGDHRLIREEELPPLEGPGEVHLEREPVLDDGLHLRAEHHVAVAPGLLGFGQRDVGVAQQFFGAGAEPGRDADAGRERAGPAGDLVGLTQHLEYPLGHQLGADVEAAAIDQHDELVPPETGGGVACPDRQLQALGDRPQELVPGGVTVCVVDRLEAVEVQEQHCHRGMFAACSREQLLGPVEGEHAVGQIGERVVECLVAQLPRLLLDQPEGPGATAAEGHHERRHEAREHGSDREGEPPDEFRRDPRLVPEQGRDDQRRRQPTDEQGPGEQDRPPPGWSTRRRPPVRAVSSRSTFYDLGAAPVPGRSESLGGPLLGTRATNCTVSGFHVRFPPLGAGYPASTNGRWPGARGGRPGPALTPPRRRRAG